MRDTAKRARKQRVRNALFGVLPLDRAPGDVADLAHSLTVLLPWGSLLRAVALPDADAIRRLLAMLVDDGDADARFVFGYGAADAADAAALPSLDDVAARYRACGFDGARVRALAAGDVRSLGTTWADKLSFSGHARRFVEVRICRASPSSPKSPSSPSSPASSCPS